VHDRDSGGGVSGDKGETWRGPAAKTEETAGGLGGRKIQMTFGCRQKWGLCKVRQRDGEAIKQ